MGVVTWAVFLATIFVVVIDVQCRLGISYNTPKGGTTVVLPPPDQGESISVGKEDEEELESLVHACKADNTQTIDSAGNPHPDVATFDGKTVQMFTDSKFVLARSELANDNPCRFQLRATTHEDSREVDWLGVSFGTHNNVDKYANNFALGLARDDSDAPLAQIRGSGFSAALVVDTPYTFTTGDGLTTVTVVSDDPDAALVLEGRATDDSGCRFKVMYGVSDGYGSRGGTRVELTDGYSSEVVGLCGSPDGNAKNDLTDSFGNVVADTELGHQALSDSWIEGAHQREDA